MRAIYKSKAEPGLWMGTADKPEPGPREVLIRVRRAAICGTDMHIFNWDSWAQKTIPVPMIVGHEYCGEVEAVGSEVTLVKVGQRVSGEGHLVCGQCRNCRGGREHLCINTVGVGVNRQGAFADYLTIPEHNVFPIPDGIPDEVVAILDPLGNAVHTALSYDLVGEDVLITGAGPIGLMAAAVCRHVGARHIVVTDLSEERLRLAETMGATRGVMAGQTDLRAVMADLGMTEGFDVGLEMSGAAPALHDMIGAMTHGGKIALLGLFSKPVELDLSAAIFKGLQFKGVYGREMFETWYKMISMLQTGLDVTPVITHRLPFEAFEDGFAALNEGRACKVVLDLAA
jgi:threonine 3-dehydrogenase